VEKLESEYSVDKVIVPTDVTEPEHITESIVFAAKQEEPNTLNEIDVYLQGNLGDIIS